VITNSFRDQERFAPLAGHFFSIRFVKSYLYAI